MPAVATILIAARNASATIERAVRSAVAQGHHPIVLVDDFSSDDTARRARRVGGDRLTVIQPPSHKSLGLTRQTALDAVTTPFGIWLDTDDEFLPGRVDRLVRALFNDNADIASDGVELFDGDSSRFREQLPIPEFLKAHHPLARLFERNYLQGIGYVAFRTEFARTIGYDQDLHGAEDVDFALRAIAARAKFTLIDVPGYRLYAYPSSMSRKRQNQSDMYCQCLLKHSYESVRRLFSEAGYDSRVSAWGLASMALFRRDFKKALDFVAAAESLAPLPHEIIEPAGPCPMPESWRAAFYRGSAFSMQEAWPDAEFWLTQAEVIQPTAEGANNLGVARARNGKPAEAQDCFRRSLERLPDYSDAQANQESETPSRITLHPLRREPTRRDY